MAARKPKLWASMGGVPLAVPDVPTPGVSVRDIRRGLLCSGFGWVSSSRRICKKRVRRWEKKTLLSLEYNPGQTLQTHWRTGEEANVLEDLRAVLKPLERDPGTLPLFEAGKP